MLRQTRLSDDLFSTLGEFKATSTQSSGLSKVPRYMINCCQKCLPNEILSTDDKKLSSYGISNLLHYSCVELLQKFNDGHDSTSLGYVKKISFASQITSAMFLKTVGSMFRSIQYHKGQILASKSVLENKRCQMAFVTMYKCGLDRPIIKLLLDLHGVTGVDILSLDELETALELPKNINAVVYLVPVGLSYDLIPDIPVGCDRFGIANSLYRILAADVQNYGSLRVDVFQPVPLKEFLKSANDRLVGNFDYNMSATMLVLDHLRFDILNRPTIMSTQLIAFLLLTRYRQGATVQQLTSSCHWIIDELYTRNINVGFTGDCEYVVPYACKMLSIDLIHVGLITSGDTISDSDADLEKSMEIFLVPTTRLPYSLKLYHHGQPLSTIFFLESAIAVSLVSLISAASKQALIENSFSARIRVERKQLIAGALKIIEILTPQFIFCPPCSSINEIVELRIELMVSRGYFIADDPPPYMKSHDRYGLFDSDSDDDFYHTEDPRFFQYIIVKRKMYAYRAVHMFYNILAPIIDSYLITGESLRRLLDGHMTIESFMRNTTNLASSLIESGQYKYSESVNIENFRHALNLYQEYGVITINENSSTVGLVGAYKSDSSIDQQLRTLAISKYRLYV